jgi:cytochrome d ubiquinol oxidase subunit I
LHLFGWVDESNERVIGPAVPGALSLLAYDELDAEVTGLDAFEPANRPPVQATFQFFHLMVAIGMTLIGISWLGMLLWWRGWLFDTSRRLSRVYLWLLTFAVLLPQISNQSGWFTAEIGRQPWIVYGLLRTSHGLSEAVDAGHVLFSLVLFGLIYLLLFVLFIFLLDRKIRQGPIVAAPEATSAKRYVPESPKEQ